MNPFRVVVGRTYGEIVRRRPFIFMTIFYIIVLSCVVGWPKISDLFSSKPGHVVVVNESHLALSAQDFSKSVGLGYTWSNGAASQLTTLKDDIRHGTNHIDAVVVIGQDSSNKIQLQFINNDKADSLIPPVQSFVQSTYTYHEMKALGVTPAAFAKLTTPVGLNHVSLSAPSKKQDPSAAYMASFLLYIFIFVYGMMIAQSVVTEKSTRVQEILIASVKPKYLYFGKIAGITLSGLTQLFILLGVVLGVARYVYPSGSILGHLKVSPDAIVLIVLSFLFGYLFFALLMASVGSVVSRTEDLQPILAPILYLFIAAYLVSIFAPMNPNAPWVTICSFIPGLSQQVMIVRYMLTYVPTWQLFVSYGLLAISILVVGYLGVRIYRMGVTVYGQRPKLRQFLKMLREQY